MKVHGDIAEVLDEGSMTAFIMLNVSVAFDVTDTEAFRILIWKQGKCLNLGEVVPADRTHCVLVANKISPDVGLRFTTGGPIYNQVITVCIPNQMGKLVNAITLNIIAMLKIHKCTLL